MSNDKLTDQEYRKLVKAYQEGDASAMSRIIEASEWIVKSIVSRYDPDLNEELLAAGRYGLTKAAEKFDLAKPFKFLVYATWWIRHYVHKELGLSNG